MKKITISALAMIIVAITGCAGTPQKPIALSQHFYSSNDNKVIGIYMDELPKADTHIVGAACLLCYGIASLANSSLTSHIQTLSTTDMIGIDKTIAKLVSERGVTTNIINNAINLEELKKFSSKEKDFAKQDYRPLRASLGVYKLIVVDVAKIGAYRPYSGYIPTGDPAGVVTGKTYTIDLATNKYELYEDIDIKVNSQGEWDEPPSFPGISNAYYQAIEMAKEKISSLFK